MRPWLLVTSGLALALYPLFVLFSLHALEAELLWAGLLLLVMLRLVTSRWLWQQGSLTALALLAVPALLLLAPLLPDFRAMLGIRFYPVVLNAIACTIFFASLFTARPLVERFARFTDPDLPTAAIRYTRRVTWVWALFLAANTLVALFTAIWASDMVWALYNGLISYLLMGLLFIGEYLVRIRLRQRWQPS